MRIKRASMTCSESCDDGHLAERSAHCAAEVYQQRSVVKYWQVQFMHSTT